MAFTKISIPEGDRIVLKDGHLQVSDRPIIAFIEGDGTGPDIWAASQRVFDAAVEKAYGIIMQRADALDGVIAGVNLVEDDPTDHPVGLGPTFSKTSRPA